MRQLSFLTIAFLLSACAGNGDGETTVPGRWYTAAQVEQGAPLYQAHCAACHGEDGSATPAWRTPLEDGNYPPPPLNGTAHTWHHPLAQLDYTIANGGVAFGGVMPGFGAVLEEDERLAIVAWFQSLWSDDIYARWMAIQGRSR